MEHNTIQVTIDHIEIQAKEGQSIVQAIREAGMFIPTLCDYKSLPPAGTCRLCTVKVAQRFVPACTTPVYHGMIIENSNPEINEIRKSLIEMLFVEGNHMCPSCEKSGNCELQALAYHYRMTAPQFPFSFHQRKVDAELPHLVMEHNRCIQCLRCVRGVKAKDGHDLYGFVNRGGHIQISVDHQDPEILSEEFAQKSMDICPVGALIKKGDAYITPIGERRFDQHEIGSPEDSQKFNKKIQNERD